MTNTTTTKEIQVDIDFAGLYAQFMREAHLQADRIQHFMVPPARDYSQTEQTIAALRAMQAVLAPLNIASQAMTTVGQVEEVRGLLASIVKAIDERATALECTDDEQAQRMTVGAYDAFGGNG